MTGTLLAVVVALLGGAAIAFQSPLASLMSERIGSLESAFVVHLGGALIAGAPLLVLGGGLGDWRTVPWYALASGGLGIVLILAVSYTIPRVGVAVTVALIVLAQLIVGVGLDHAGALGVEIRTFGPDRAIGALVMLIGVWLMLR